MSNAPQPSRQVEWRLILDDGSNAVKIVPVTRDDLLIGRALTTDIPLDDARISRHHVRLTRQGSQLIAEDLQTVNGTLINGQSLTQPYSLQPNDAIGLGPFTIKVEQAVVPQSRRDTRAYAVPTQAGSRWGLFLVAIVAGLVLAGLLGWGLYQFLRSKGQDAAALKGSSLTVVQAPANNSSVPVNQPVRVQATASDPAGVIRVELWVNGRKVDEVDTQLVEVTSSLNAALRWQPDAPGAYVLELRAYNAANQVSIQPVVNLSVFGPLDTPTPPLSAVETALPAPTASPTIAPLLPPDTATPIPTPTATAIPTASPLPSPTPLPATPTPSTALLSLNVPALNVRTGPGTEFSLIGLLAQGRPVEIVGQANAGQGQWWEIRFAAGPGGVGWVSADPTFGLAYNAGAVPVISVSTPLSPPTQTPAASRPPANTSAPAATAMATVVPGAGGTAIYAPAGQTLLIVSNRSLLNQPALLTLSGGKSVRGGREIDAPAGSDIRVVLEPDFYRALWSSPARPGGFSRGADFTAVKDKIIVMWIVPEEGRTDTELYDSLTIGGSAPASTPTPAGTATPGPILGNYIAPTGKAIFVAANRTLNNSFADLTLSGGGFGGGKSFKLDAGVEIQVELLPGSYRAVWTSPARRKGFSAGREFQVSAGEVILSWIIPDQGQVFMQFPGQEAEQINN